MTQKYTLLKHKMLKTVLNLSFDEYNSNADNCSDLSTPKISLAEVDGINTSFPFNPPEFKNTQDKRALEIFNVTKKKRKEKGDNIRKKIKTYFHKYLRKVKTQNWKEQVQNIFLKLYLKFL